LNQKRWKLDQGV